MIFGRLRTSLPRYSPVLVIVALCALPAQGADSPTTLELHTLTPIDSVPTKAEILNFAGPDPTAAILHLRDLALSPDADFGVRLRAIRALPQFCSVSPTCQELDDANMHPARLAVRDVLAGVTFTDRDGRTILRLRAAIESLGVIQSGRQSDVDVLVPFLAHTSRDIRAATARALRDLCLPSAIPALRARYDQEPITQGQVRLAISDALSALNQCSQ